MLIVDRVMYINFILNNTRRLNTNILTHAKYYSKPYKSSEMDVWSSMAHCIAILFISIDESLISHRSLDSNLYNAMTAVPTPNPYIYSSGIQLVCSYATRPEKQQRSDVQLSERLASPGIMGALVRTINLYTNTLLDGCVTLSVILSVSSL